MIWDLNHEFHELHEEIFLFWDLNHEFHELHEKTEILSLDGLRPRFQPGGLTGRRVGDYAPEGHRGRRIRADTEVSPYVF